MSVADDCPMMSLPDEVLCQILALITDVSSKMQMESVCKRFQRISTTQTNSWNGNDKVELVAGCKAFHSPDDMMKYLPDCTQLYPPNNDLNGQRMSMSKWAKAIDQLLQRAIVHKLCIHLSNVATDDLPFLHQVFEVMQNHASHLRLTYIEFHRSLSGFESGDNACHELADKLYSWAVSGSAKTIESIVFSLEKVDFAEEKWGQFCAGVAACVNLKSFSIKFPLNAGQFMPLSAALQGKPLKSITLDTIDNESFQLSNAPVPLTQFLAPICESVTSEGITSLKITLPNDEPSYGLVEFAKTLHPPTTQSLVELWISNASVNHVVQDLDHIPVTFPNLKELRLVNVYDPVLDEDLLLNTQFFTVCDETPLVNRRLFIAMVGSSDRQELSNRIAAFCDGQGIERLYGEPEGAFQSWLTMKKGNGTIVLMEIVPYISMSDSDMSDFGDNEVDEMIDYDEEEEDEDDEDGEDDDYEDEDEGD